MGVYNALTINDSFGASPRSHFITADGRDLDLRYLMLKNLPEKLKAMGVLFSAGSDINIDADGKIYYAVGINITDADSDQVLVTKKYVNNLLTGNWERAGAVKEHESTVAHLTIGFSAEGNFGINYSAEECISGFNGSEESKKKAASLYHHHDGRYAYRDHTHDYGNAINQQIEALLKNWGSIEVYPYTFLRRDVVGIAKGTDPYTIYPDNEPMGNEDIDAVAKKKGPPMDSLVNVLSLRKRLQPKFMSVRLAQRPYIEVAGTEVRYINDGDAETHTLPANENLSWDTIYNLKDLLEYLHPGLKLAELDKEVRVFWGCTNLNKTQIENWVTQGIQKFGASKAERLIARFFTNIGQYPQIHDSLVKFDASSILVPVLDFRNSNLFDPTDWDSLDVDGSGIENHNTNFIDESNYYCWIAIPDDAYESDVAPQNEFWLRNIENKEDAITPTGAYDNWESGGYVLPEGEKNQVVKTTEEIEGEEVPCLKNSLGVTKFRDTNGQAYTVYVSNYKNAGELYRFALVRSENTKYND